MKTAGETLKRLKRQEQGAKWRCALQYLALMAAIAIGGTLIGCNDDSSGGASKTPDDSGTAVATETTIVSDSDAGQVAWLKDYDEAIALAKQLDRPVLIDFAASWCTPCVMMDKHVWPKPTVLEALDSKVVPLRVDVDSKSALPLTQRYKIEYVPTILLIDTEGQELKREGYVDAEQLTEMIKSAMRVWSPKQPA